MQASESGMYWYSYYQRKVVWCKILDMVHIVWDVADACNKLYDIYGHQSSLIFTTNQKRKDCKNGGHPSLNGAAI